MFDRRSEQDSADPVSQSQAQIDEALRVWYEDQNLGNGEQLVYAVSNAVELGLNVAVYVPDSILGQDGIGESSGLSLRHAKKYFTKTEEGFRFILRPKRNERWDPRYLDTAIDGRGYFVIMDRRGSLLQAKPDELSFSVMQPTDIQE